MFNEHTLLHSELINKQVVCNNHTTRIIINALTLWTQLSKLVKRSRILPLLYNILAQYLIEMYILFVCNLTGHNKALKCVSNNLALEFILFLFGTIFNLFKLFCCVVSCRKWTKKRSQPKLGIFRFGKKKIVIRFSLSQRSICEKHWTVRFFFVSCTLTCIYVIADVCIVWSKNRKRH